MVSYMINDVDEYIKQNPESYLGYYCKGLKGLDMYFENGKGIKENYIRALKTASILIRREDIIKYYFLSLLISRDKRKLKRFRKFEKETGIILNPYKFKLINCTIQYMKKWRPKLSILKKCEYFDSIDYLILYVLEKEYKIKVLQNCNYIYESMKSGRKSISLQKAMCCFGVYNKRDVEDMVKRYPKFFEAIEDSSIYKNILEEEYISSINSNNIALVEKIIESQQEALFTYGLGSNKSISLNAEKNNKKMMLFLDKYIHYCLYNDHKNRDIAEKFQTYLLENINETKAMYLYYNDIKLNNIKSRLETCFNDKMHFSKVELMYEKEFVRPNVMKEKNIIYKLKFNIELDTEKVEVHFNLENEKIKAEAYTGFENYYMLKETPNSFRIWDCNSVIEGAAKIEKIITS